ncbi:MAG: hypothetical protein HBSAPP03_03950 [Phycisphaerae bacterium]|nr:MAG: hypothetical protein HBSAPP03_03950 [Phycisphaerae bacterium]
MQALFTFLDFLLVAFGFGLIVFLHELGHFLAARWAGIRVLAFAVGFGPALFSYRRGLGLRRGSSEPDYLRRLRTAGADLNDPPTVLAGISPTEYRLNVLPFGGYVKMLGQVDGDASAVSAAADGYQRCVPWKRMVVISAGVIANLITAALIFMLVFKVGLKTETTVIGAVAPGSPAARAVVLAEAEAPALTGLRPGDRLISIDGDTLKHFPDITTAVAMAPRGQAVVIVFERDGRTLTAEVTPEKGDLGLLQIGIEPARSATLFAGETPEEDRLLRAYLAREGLDGVEPGWTLAAINDASNPPGFYALRAAAEASNGQPLRLTFASPDGARRVTLPRAPTPRLEVGHVPREGAPAVSMEHLLGLTPVMKVGDASPKQGPKASEKGFIDGDVFARLGGVEFPNIEQGIRELRAHRGKVIPVSVLRKDDHGAWREIDLPNVEVSAAGTLGFGISDTGSESLLLSRPPALIRPATGRDRAEYTPAAASLVQSPGMELVTINGAAVANFAELRDALRRAVLGAAPAQDVSVRVGFRRPAFRGDTPSSEVHQTDWVLTPRDVSTLASLGWESPVPAELFVPDSFLLKAEGPLGAVSLGLAETRRVMLSTYLTFKRLTVDRTVKVEHLKGPIGIAHLGTAVASRGMIWLLFFLALISVNLAVINFLPLPIVDGGQFLFLVYEQIRGRPAPIAVQNVLTYAGLLLIACVFLVVTFNDVKNLLGL